MRHRRIGCVVLVDPALQVLDLEIVLLVEDVVDRGQSEVLVHASVAGDVVVADRRHEDLADRSICRRAWRAHDAEGGRVEPAGGDERARARVRAVGRVGAAGAAGDDEFDAAREAALERHAGR